MPKYLTFNSLDKIGQEVLALLENHNVAVFGIPGCGKNSVIRVMWDKEIKGINQKILITASEIVRLSLSLGNSTFAQYKKGKTEKVLTDFSDIKKIISKSKSTLVIIHLLEDIKEYPSAQKLIYSLSLEFDNKIRFLTGCDMSLATNYKSYKTISSVVSDKQFLINQMPKELINKVINEYCPKISKRDRDQIIHMSGGNVAKINDHLINIPPVVINYLKLRPVSEDIFENSLTKQELVVYKKLIESGREYLSKENIAITIWGQNYQDKYSEWALYKVIQSLREKIKANENKTRIFSKKGRGHLLV